MTALDLLQEQHQRIDALFEAVLAAPPETRARCFRELAGALTQHAIIESATFYPALEHAGLDEVATEALRAHEDIKYHLEEVCAMDLAAADFLSCVEALRSQQRAHVKDEEQRIFAAAQDALGEKRLLELGEEIRSILRLWESHEPQSPTDETTPWLTHETRPEH